MRPREALGSGGLMALVDQGGGSREGEGKPQAAEQTRRHSPGNQNQPEPGNQAGLEAGDRPAAPSPPCEFPPHRRPSRRKGGGSEGLSSFFVS